MPEDPRPRILCVDDEKNVLEAFERTLRNLFIVESAVGGIQGLEVLREKGPFVTVVSDLRMPKMNGVEFLSRARDVAPDTVRVLLTGQTDMEAAISAVNEGNIFRFLTKPCSPSVLVKSLMACAAQYLLVTSERVLLEQTLRGSIKALTDILALANPAAFGRATRVRQSVSELMGHFNIGERWPTEVAAMLSQIGYMILPPKTQDKLYAGEDLTGVELKMVERIPETVEQLLANIPRLELVREILRSHNKHFAEERTGGVTTMRGEIPWGARALKIALDHDILESENNADNHAFQVMRGRTGWYDPAILEAFAELRGRGRHEQIMHELTLSEIVEGMLFGEDLKSESGLVLAARGQEATPSLLERIRNFSQELRILEPVRMIERHVRSEPFPGVVVATCDDEPRAFYAAFRGESTNWRGKVMVE